MLGDGNSLRETAVQVGPRGPSASDIDGREGFGALEIEGFNLAEYWRLALKHRILIIACLLTALVIGVGTTFLMTPLYSASTILQIDREAARVLNVEDLGPRDAGAQGEEFFQTQYGLLRSRSLAQRVVESLGLASSNAFFESMGVAPPEANAGASASALRRDAATSIVQSKLTVTPVRSSRLVEVTFTSPDPSLSAKVANAFAENFIQSNLDRKVESSAYARDFLEGRIAQTKQKLEDAERQLVAYATEQQIINITDGVGPGNSQSLASSDLGAINGALAQATAARVAAEEKWRQSSSAPAQSLPEVIENPSIQRLTELRATLASTYQQKLSIYKADYPEMLELSRQMQELDQQIEPIVRGIRNSIRNQYAVARNQELALQRRVNELKGDVLDLRDRSIQYNILEREVDTSRTLYDGLLQRYKEVGVTGGVTTNNVSIIDTAEVPDHPSSPRLLLNLALAGLVGLGLGILAAFVVEILDESLTTPDDVESKLGVPVLGAVPFLEKGQTPLDALNNVRSGLSEAYYSLRTALQFSTPNGAPASLLITSARPAEGKSTTAFALALSLARVGKRVLLVDGDLRNPSMHRVVGTDNDRGMSNLLSGSAELLSVVRPTKNEHLSFIACGPLPPNPAELWGGDRLRRFLREAADHYDHVVIDGPPVLGFADAPILAATVEGTLFVLQSRETRRGQARGALRRLHLGTVNLLGVVLTKFNTRATSYGGYDYAYDYNYGGESKDSKARKP